MLPSSSITRATVALVSSEALPAMTAAERSSHQVESKDSATESESDAARNWRPLCHSVSENDVEITGDQSHTVEETAIAHEEAGNTNGKHAATGGTEVGASTKKPGSIMTAAQPFWPQRNHFGHCVSFYSQEQLRHYV